MIPKKQRILLMTSEFPPLPGGIGNHAHNLAKHLTKEEFKVHVLADQRSNDLNEDLTFDEEQDYEVTRVLITKTRFFMYFTRFKKLFSLASSADIIMASGKFPLWAVAYLSIFKKKYYVAVAHGTEVNFRSLLPKTLVNLSLKRFHEIIAVSNFTKTLMSSLRLKSVTVIPNGFDVSNWQIPLHSANLAGNPKLITIGHVSERKGQGNVIALLPKLIEKFPNIHYHNVGLPTEVHRFETMAKDLGVLSHVTFHGYLEQEAMQSMLLDSDVCILLSSETSTGDVEGFGIVLLEANAMGIPVIAALGSGVEDAVANGKSGFLVSHIDAVAFGEALETLLNDKDRFALQAKAWAKEFNWELVIKKYVEVLNKTI